MDSATKLAWDFSISAVVLGAGNESVLIPLDESASAPREYAKAHGFCYAGIMAYDPKAGKAFAECEPGMEFTMACAVSKFALHVKERLTPPDVASLERMYRLEDTRTN